MGSFAPCKDYREDYQDNINNKDDPEIDISPQFKTAMFHSNSPSPFSTLSYDLSENDLVDNLIFV